MRSAPQPNDSRNPSEASKFAGLAALISHYGDGADGLSPTEAQWQRLLDGTLEASITLINFFKLRESANYASSDEECESAGSGGEAMMRYAAVSGPALERVGGKFLLTAPVEGAFMGEEEDWDMVAIGSYPSRKALLALFKDQEYIAAYAHRRAAVERQRVLSVT